ncbi:MAG: hypothetical protein WC763_05045 [Candidatus Paceibacterota bacterium]|jgi:hypothetical protein
MLTFQLKEEHLKLLSHSAWYWSDVENGAPCMDQKRPYGNSWLIDDLRGILPGVTDEELMVFHKELVTALEIITRTRSFVPGTYSSETYSNDWKKEE